MPESSIEFDPDFADPSEWAGMYRDNGIQVVPTRHKAPRLKSWKEYQHALVPDQQFQAWYGPNGEFAKSYDMGMVTGTASGRVLMIDLDTYKPGGDAAGAWWRGILAVHNNGLELETWEQRTGGGGRQMFFSYPSGWIAGNGKTAINVDIRCQGGFAVLPPTRHDSGGTYSWIDGRAPWECAILAAPDWLLIEVERLLREHGGNVSPLSLNKTETYKPGTVVNAFGSQIDGRETVMRDLVWAAVLDWRRERPIKPGEAESRVKAAEKYLLYEAEVAPQATYPLEISKTEALDREGRGPAEFWVKWSYAMSKWHEEVAEAAAIPNPKADTKAPVDPGTVKPQPIEWLDMSNWDNVPVPIRKWAILDRVPLNQVGLFSGEGGTGKSIIELMKDVAHVTGSDWLGSLPEQGGAFYLGAEDEAEEIHIRLAAIAKHYKTTFGELTRLGLKVLPLLGKDSMLCVQSGRGNHIETTPLYRQLYEAAGDLKPKNISIDTLSRAFGGDEINRVQVYAFAMHMQAIAKVAQGSVTILSHPSLAGMASGSGISGSTAWHGAFRFRQYLKGIREDGESNPADDDLRELEFKKNQYGPRGRPIILRYVDGLFLPVNGATDPERVAREARADGLFVKLLRRFCERDDRVTHQVSSPHYYAPKVFADEPEAKQQGFRKSELEDAMRRLMAEKRVLVEVFGKDSRRQNKLILAPGT